MEWGSITAPGVPGIIAGGAAFAALSLFLARGLRAGKDSPALLGASLATLLWIIAQHPLFPAPAQAALGVLVYSAWLIVLLQLADLGAISRRLRRSSRRHGARLVGGSLALVTALAVAWLTTTDETRGGYQLALLLQLSITVLGLAMLDQARGNAHPDQRHRQKFLLLGMLVLFGFDFVLFSEALLFGGLNPDLQAARPAVHALAAPLFAVAVRRYRDHPIGLRVSRAFVFQSTALVIAGFYLLVMAAAGYYVRIFGGEWGQILQVLFTAVALLALAVIALSSDARARLRRFMAEHFFEQRFDYQAEWSRLTRALAGTADDEPIASRALRTLGDLLQSPGGAIWTLHPDGSGLLLDRRNVGWSEPLTRQQVSAIASWVRSHPGLIDLNELSSTDRHAESLREVLPAWDTARFLIPLHVNDRLWGLAVLREPTIAARVDGETRALLELCALQTAAFLAERNASDSLAQSRQLDAFNQMNAFVVHDVKTVISQLALLVQNADAHRDNPEFIDDMIQTTRHAVERMQKLLQQLQDRQPGETLTRFDVVELCREVVAGLQRQTPAPTLDGELTPFLLEAPREQLADALGHLLRNAIEATPRSGQVRVNIQRDRDWLRIRVIDTGCGMSEAFLANELFAPFQSSKGLAGMGIGSYQARQIVRRLGGELLARSALEQGTTMEVLLPLNSNLPEES